MNDDLWHDARTPARRAELARLEREQALRAAFAVLGYQLRAINCSFVHLGAAAQTCAQAWAVIGPDHQR